MTIGRSVHAPGPQTGGHTCLDMFSTLLCTDVRLTSCEIVCALMHINSHCEIVMSQWWPGYVYVLVNTDCDCEIMMSYLCTNVDM
jgi:hypothetical protein